MSISIRHLCTGLEAGRAPLLQRVTPTTAELLHWWFGQGPVQARAGLNFRPAQRRALLRAIVAHELGAGATAPPATNLRLNTGAGHVRVLLALLVWQLLNHRDARASGRDDPRFTPHFLTVASHPRSHERLLAALRGQPLPGGHGARDFGTADVVRLAELLAPPPRQDTVLAFVCATVCSGAGLARHAAADGVIAITDGRVEALECLARWPQRVVFDDQGGPARVQGAARRAWREQLRRMLATQEARGLHVVFAGR